MNTSALVLFCAILGVSGNLALRSGMSGFTPREGQSPLIGVIQRLLTTPLLWIGLLGWGLGALVVAVKRFRWEPRQN